MAAALGWGALAASSLVIGALLGLARDWSNRFVGLVLAFGMFFVIFLLPGHLFQNPLRFRRKRPGG